MTTPSFNLTGAVFTVCATAFITAPPLLIYDVLIDFTRYHEWNSFVYAVDVPEGVTGPRSVWVGMPMKLYTRGLVEGLNTTSDERVTWLEPRKRDPFAAWKYDGGLLGGAVMQAEHVSLLWADEDGYQHVSWETYYGPGAMTLLPVRERLQQQFEVQAVDLTERVYSLIGWQPPNRSRT
ncbi:hypothetical protein B0O99DRAFT_687786 [Bisporella sp. PMI_857]|nr:hypothetical protein B0O99DRAFT_687786 [Bisporella sp. PMI_857]